MKITGRNTSKRPTNSHIVSRTMLNGKFFTKEVYDNLWTLDKTNLTRGRNHFLHCFFVQKWKWPLQEWTCFNEIIVQQWPIIRAQDIVTFGVSVIMTLFRHVNLSILHKTRQGAGSLAIPVSSLRQAAPQRPVAKQHGGMPSPRAQNLQVYWLARQIEDCRSAQAADI